MKSIFNIALMTWRRGTGTIKKESVGLHAIVFKLLFYPALGQTAPTAMKLKTGVTS